MPTCEKDGCSNARSTRGWCRKHYIRWYRHGDLDHVGVRGVSLAFTVPVPSYSTMHKRLALRLGPASSRQCISCGGQAKDWACTRNKTLTGSTGGFTVTYSGSLDDYEPMCRPCHKVFDMAERGN